ncbi:ethanolamine ammonia-lyase subunit EutC [Undibacterium terreum]|uniref:Ethanolamine ammonia-lyase small subunit n=1 Tax=Undibacterium terreum TaxID=1224302 RepID=A0A916UFD3_9BURK|nr:ethanolamine ammonia-lyase subunit EutC [Undibacterium terreum]GGC70987.1 ethanolamine ammonia-lyase light chain [Undibacterium terreum]
MSDKKAPVTRNPWDSLRRFTAARIALGRAGISLPSATQLDFQLAHAKARDAVHLALDIPSLQRDINASINSNSPCLVLHSAAADRGVYLQRPDLGRMLDSASRKILENAKSVSADRRYDVAFVIADGLSALAIAQHAAPLLHTVWERMAKENWSIAPVCIVQQGRVAIGDEVGELLGARMVVVLIGERPGLSSPDSMGLYLTWAPRNGLTDASRNCISNVRPEGLRYEDAADKLFYLMSQSFARQLSGVELKDDAADAPALLAAESRNFLLE